MAKYLIHAYKERMWYVEKYLIPSMLKQSIDKSDINVFTDDGTLGCLEAFMQSCLTLEGKGTWHLQDDVIINSQFKRWTEEYFGDIIVCGFCSRYDDKKVPGLVYPNMMWYSFPCIYIPDTIARECAVWFYREAMYNPKYKVEISKKKYADVIFNNYVNEHYSGEEVLNLAPNLVNHIDYLIGGSTVNKQRSDIVQSVYWEEPELIQYWEDTICQ